jgi:hypothetical protein
MADQATMRPDGPAGARLRSVPIAANAESVRRGPEPEPQAGPGNVVSGVAEFGENLLTLAELQARLVALELQQNLEAAKIPVPVILAGAVLAVVSLPLVLAGIAELLVSELGMKRGYALLGVAVVALAIAGTAIAFAAGRFRRALAGFAISREEFARNLNWVRTVLLHSGRAARPR